MQASFTDISGDQSIQVRLLEIDGKDEVELEG